MMFGRSRKVALGALGMIYGIFIFPGFFAPYDYAVQNRRVAFAPPTRIHFVDRNGRFHTRPFVYRWKTQPGNLDEYIEDRSTLFPVYLLANGPEYRLAGVIPSRVHLFSVGRQTNLFLFGTDEYGRDLFSRVLYGGRISLLAGLLAAGISVGLGVALGGVSGYYGGSVDSTMMRLAELFMAVPWLYLLLAIRAFLPLHLDPAGIFLLLLGVSGAIGWARPARLVRGVVLSARDREYVLAARGFGASDFYVLRTHVLPQAYGVAMTQAALYVPQYITAEVVLSFFGLGIGEPVPSWGNMLAQLQSIFVLESCWWMYAPAVVLVIVLLIFGWFFRVEAARFNV